MKSLRVTWRLSRLHYKYLKAFLGTDLTPPNARNQWLHPQTSLTYKIHRYTDLYAGKKDKDCFIPRVHNSLTSASLSGMKLVAQDLLPRVRGVQTIKEWLRVYSLPSVQNTHLGRALFWKLSRANSNMPSTLEITPQNKWGSPGQTLQRAWRDPWRKLASPVEEEFVHIISSKLALLASEKEVLILETGSTGLS